MLIAPIHPTHNGTWRISACDSSRHPASMNGSTDPKRATSAPGTVCAQSIASPRMKTAARRDSACGDALRLAIAAPNRAAFASLFAVLTIIAYIDAVD